MRKPFSQNFTLTQEFGVNKANYEKFGLQGHNGLDYGLPTGTDVLAPHSGKVIEVAFDANGYGNYIKIENDKEGSVLAHLKESFVGIGAQVTEGQLIAHSDNTGNSTGAHLHWGYYTFPRNRQNGFAGFINQLPLLPANNDNMYKGYDLTNKDSMKVAVDILVRVQGGEFVDKPKYDEALKKIQELSKRPESCPPVNPIYKDTLVKIKQLLDGVQLN